jgi:hypothetical protein
MMITDGETFSYRTGQSRPLVRFQSRARTVEPTVEPTEPAAGVEVGARVEPRATARPEPREQVVRPSEESGQDRLVRLEHLAQRLEGHLAKLDGAVQELVARYIEPRATAPVQSEAPQTDQRNASLGMGVREMADVPPGGEFKVSLFADGTAQAILGHVRIEHFQEAESES